MTESPVFSGLLTVLMHKIIKIIKPEIKVKGRT